MLFSSDVLIKLEGGHVIRSHKFVLLAHSKEWVFSDSTSLSQLDLSGMFRPVIGFSHLCVKRHLPFVLIWGLLFGRPVDYISLM